MLHIFSLCLFPLPHSVQTESERPAVPKINRHRLKSKSKRPSTEDLTSIVEDSTDDDEEEGGEVELETSTTEYERAEESGSAGSSVPDKPVEETRDAESAV